MINELMVKFQVFTATVLRGILGFSTWWCCLSALRPPSGHKAHLPAHACAEKEFHFSRLARASGPSTPGMAAHHHLCTTAAVQTCNDMHACRLVTARKRPTPRCMTAKKELCHGVPPALQITRPAHGIIF